MPKLTICCLLAHAHTQKECMEEHKCFLALKHTPQNTYLDQTYITACGPVLLRMAILATEPNHGRATNPGTPGGHHLHHHRRHHRHHHHHGRVTKPGPGAPASISPPRRPRIIIRWCWTTRILVRITSTVEQRRDYRLTYHHARVRDLFQVILRYFPSSSRPICIV